jgi:hypothetical protein
MRAGIGQRHHPGRMLQQLGHTLVDGIEKEAEERGLQILLETEIEHHVERVAPLLARDLGDVAVGEPSILAQNRHRDDDPVPIALEHRSRPRLAQILPEPLAETGIAEHRLQLVGRETRRPGTASPACR